MIAATVSNVYNGSLSVLDAVTLELKYQCASFTVSYFTTVATGDTDNDGHIDIVAGQGSYHSGAQGTYLIVFNGETLEEEWRSDNIGSNLDTINQIKIDDFDKDGNPDIIARVNNHQILVYDGVTRTLTWETSMDANTMDVSDVDCDGYPEIVIGYGNGSIDIYDGVSFSIEGTLFAFTHATINSMTVTDLDGDHLPEFIIAADDGFMSILEGDVHALMWRSEFLSEGKDIIVQDVDSNGLPDIITSSYSDMYRFEFNGSL